MVAVDASPDPLHFLAQQGVATPARCRQALRSERAGSKRRSTIDHHHDSEYLALLAPARPRPLIAAACLPHHSGRDDDWDDRCHRALRHIWDHHLATNGVARLYLGHDDGGPRFYAGPVPLHAGTGLDVLTGHAGWLHGRFEYQLTDRPLPLLYVALAGDDPMAVPLQLAADTVVRCPA